MINNIEEYLTIENIFLISNWGVIPFWLLLLFSPNSSFTRFLVHSIIIPLMLGCAYVFIVYKIYLNDNFLEGFGLYLGIENLYAIFSDENFLLIDLGEILLLLKYLKYFFTISVSFIVFLNVIFLFNKYFSKDLMSDKYESMVFVE